MITAIGLVGIFIFLYRIGLRESRRKQIEKIRKELPDYISAQSGSVSLISACRHWKVDQKILQPVLEEAVSKSGGHALPSPDGNWIYDFPDFMRTEEDLQKELKTLSEKSPEGFTLSEAARYIRKKNQETQVLLEQFVQKGLFKKTKKGRTYYYFYVQDISADLEK